MEKIKKEYIVSEGIAIGKVVLLKNYEPKIIHGKINDEEIKNNLELYEKAITNSKNELKIIIDSLKNQKDNKYQILLAHISIIEDIALNEMIIAKINENNHVSKAVFDSYTMFIDMLKEVKDPLIQERFHDLNDCMKRVLRNVEGVKEFDLTKISEDTILVALDLLPSDTANLNKDYIKGIITQNGGKTSHTAIIARSNNIPAIIGLENVLSLFKEDDCLILDATNGNYIVNPTKNEITKYQEKQFILEMKIRKSMEHLSKKAKTIDKKEIDIFLNIGDINENTLKNHAYFDGVGLFRSEFLYMESNKLPDEETQFLAYKKVLETFKGKMVIIRTLDIGGDKNLPYLTLEKEENPFLGKRAIRLCLEQLDLFKTQLRALLRASSYGKLGIMFPMISSIDEVTRIKTIINDVFEKLIEEKYQITKDYQIGVMIEIPGIALMADELSKIVDFASIGTNDLCQYLLATDRMNPNIKEYYQMYHPAMFRTIKLVADAFNKNHKMISICGELGGEILATPLLLGLSIKKLSMSYQSAITIKEMIHYMNFNELELLANNCLKQNTEEKVISILEKYLMLLNERKRQKAL